MPLKEKMIKWFKLYLVTLAIALALISFGAFLYSLLTNIPILDALCWAMGIGAVLLVGIGLISFLPLSEHFYVSPYTRGAGANPAILREGVRGMKKRRKPKKEMAIFVIVGLTLLMICFLIFS